MERKQTLFILVIIFTSTILQTESKSTNRTVPDRFIESACRATRYHSLCVQTLSAYGTNIRHNDQDLAVAALTVSLARARVGSAFISKLVGTRALRPREMPGIGPRDYMAIKDCAQTMGDSVDRLAQSVKELVRAGGSDSPEDFMWRMSNVQTWVSAALTDVSTCLDGFGGGRSTDGKVKGMVRNRVIHVARVTSNALALVNRFADRRSVKIP
ncbi:PREDICTED: 21 kDa protein [Tarenaya hassleriana]|uniref:21 kDa protein n=1 Tax=Tarenaya hassleriana TaxID=28532 RepID=UPI00053C2BFA|nr:PREDICTED: 21 kDa protein [Tarenaya hassleriana]